MPEASPRWEDQGVNAFQCIDAQKLRQSSVEVISLPSDRRNSLNRIKFRRSGPTRADSLRAKAVEVLLKQSGVSNSE
jgi:hypothetical protein